MAPASLEREGAELTAGEQGKIFISYRRQETAWPARQLYEVLIGRFGADSVFKDVDDIEPGDDFVDKITEAVAACDVLLALIGNQWLTMTDDKGRRRLDNPEDFVRLELRAALSRGVRVVPILVDGAKMPTADQLPGELAVLTRRQAVEINPVGFNTDRLLATLATTLLSPRTTPVEDIRQAEPRPSVPVPPVATLTGDPGSAQPPDLLTTPRRTPATATPPTAVQPPAVQPPAAPPTAAPPTATPPTRGNSRRPVVLVAAGLVLFVLAGVLVLRPWEPRTLAATEVRPTPADSSTPVDSSTPSASATPNGAAGRPLILAHRGGLEVHQFETQQAMEAAAAAGFSVETDVRYTKDGVAVLVHDEKATKGLDCGGRSITVSTTTWSQLSRYCRSKPTAKDPAQYPVPRLDATLEGIAAASDQAMVFLEVKTQQTADQRREFLEAPAKYGLRDRTVVTSFNQDWLAAIRKADPGGKRMLFVSDEPVAADGLREAGLWAVGVEQGIATKEYVSALKAIGVRVMIWVLNDPDQWARFAALDPDILMTAYPAKFQEWLASR